MYFNILLKHYSIPNKTKSTAHALIISSYIIGKDSEEHIDIKYLMRIHKNTKKCLI